MVALFVNLLNASITAGWVVLAVMAFRLILKRAPKYITVLLWALVAVRLVLPVSVESAFSLIPDRTPVDLAYGDESRAEEGVYSEPYGESVFEDTEVPSVPENYEDEPHLSLPDTYVPEESERYESETLETPSTPAVESEYSPAPEVSEDKHESSESTPIGGIGGTVDGDAPPADGAEGDDAADDSKASFLKKAMPTLSAIWAGGVLLMLIYLAASYLRVRRTVKEAIPLEEGVWVCDKAPTPFILGMMRPKIYLPDFVTEADAKYVLAHERAHIRRGDHLWKPIGFFLLAVYWFNPLMWLAYILLCRDIEYATDEKAIKALGSGCKKPYSMALINCSAPKRIVNACPLAFGEKNVGRRIRSVLNYKKPALWVMIAAGAACVAILLGFMTNPKTENGTADNSSISEEEESSAQSSESEAKGDTDKKDHGGRVYTVLEHRAYFDTSKRDMSTDLAWENEEDGSMTATDSARKQVLDKVQKEYNCVINTKVTDMTADMKNLLYEDVLGGTGEYDLCLGRTYAFTDYAEQGIIYDTKKLDIDTSAPWWYSEGIEELSICGKQFFLTGDIAGIETCTTSVLFFNETLYEENGGDAEALYQLVRDGEWTFDRFKDIVTGFGKDLNDDGVRTEDDLYGLLTGTEQLYNHFISDGNRLILKDENGTPYLNTLKAIRSDALIAAVDLYLNENDVIVYDIDKYNTDKYLVGHDSFTLCNINPFKEGRGLFLATSLNKAPKLKDTEDNFGILPFPKYSSETERYYSNTVISRSLFVPNSPKNTAGLKGRQLADVIDALCRYSSELILPAVYEGELRELNTDKATAMDMLEILRSNRVYRIDNVFHWDTRRLLALDGLPVTGYWERIKDDIQAQIDLTVKKLEATNDEAPPSAEKDAELTAAMTGAWYGVGEDDNGAYYYFYDSGSGSKRDYTTGNVSVSFNWVIKGGAMTFMYSVGGEKTVTSVSCDGSALIYIDETGEHCFLRTEPEEREPISWTLLEDGTLTVLGQGELIRLWDGRENEVKRVIIGEGITGIHVATFRGHTNLESVILPKSLVSIGSVAFAECTALNSIDLPDGLRKLDSSAFSDTGMYNSESYWKNGAFYVDGCLVSAKATEGFTVAEGTVLIANNAVNGHIDELVLPEGVKSINFFAFNSVGSVHLPASVEYVENGAFYNARSFTVDENNPYFSAVDGHLCDKEGKVLYTYNLGGADTVVIPEGIRYLADDALNTVFFDIKLKLPASLEKFNHEAFEHSNICEVEVAEGNRSLAAFDGVLYSKDGKTIVYYPLAREDADYKIRDGVEYVNGKAFFSNEFIKEITLPDSVKAIGDSAFWWCESLESINLPEGLRTIGDSAFDSCYALKRVVLPDSLSTLGGGAFHSAGLEEVVTGKGLITIGSHAFYGTKIKDIYLGTGVRYIGDMALYSSSLETIRISEGNRNFTVLDGVLFDADRKTLVRYPPAMEREGYTLPDSVEIIGNYAFAQCCRLKNISINDGVTKIGKSAFKNCALLTHIAIPRGIEEINNSHFEACSALDTIYYGGSKEEWADIVNNVGVSDLSEAKVVYNAESGIIEKLKPLKVFVPMDYYHGYAQTKEVFYDGTTKGLMDALIIYCGAAEGSEIISLEIRDGVAYLDVNRAFVDGISTGTTMQYEGLGALVNTVIYNLEADKVMLSCEGSTLSLPDVGEFDEPVGVFSGWLVYEMVEGERPANALLPDEEEKAMKLMCAFLKAFSEGNTEVCERLTTYGYPDGEYDFIRSFDLNTIGTMNLPQVQRFSYYFKQDGLKNGQAAFSTTASDGQASFEIVFVLSYDDVFGITLYIADAGYENIH